jgi:hypothetical protein
VQHGGALQPLLRQQRDQEALHLERGRELLAHAPYRVGLAARSRDQTLQRDALRFQEPVDGLARRGHEVQRLDLGEVLDQPLLCLPRQPLARGARSHHAQERQARADRAVDADRLVPGDRQVLHELPRGVLDLQPVLSRADAVELARRLPHRFAVQEDQCAGRVRGELQRTHRVLQLDRRRVVVRGLGDLDHALDGLVALPAELELVRPQRHVGELQPRRGAGRVDPRRARRFVLVRRQRSGGGAAQLAVHPDLHARRLGHEGEARQRPHQLDLQRLGGLRRDREAARLGPIALARDLHLVAAGEHLEREEVRQAQELAVQRDLGAGGTGLHRDEADQVLLDVVEEVHHLGRDALLAERVLRLELDERAEALGRLVLQAGAVVRARAVLVGLDQHVLAARRERGLAAQRLQAVHQVVPLHDRAALLRARELGHRLRHQLLQRRQLLQLRRGLTPGGRRDERQHGEREGEPPHLKRNTFWALSS